MNHEILNKYIGKKCAIKTLDEYIQGKIATIIGNWMEVEIATKKSTKIELVNINFIEKISVEG